MPHRPSLHNDGIMASSLLLRQFWGAARGAYKNSGKSILTGNGCFLKLETFIGLGRM
jgi:hypothetical protein